jgi:signal transduction histidine kinase
MNELLWTILGAVVVGGLLLAYLYRARSGSPDAPLAAVQTMGRRVLGDREQAAQILEHMSEGVSVLSRDLKPEFVNGSGRALLGLQDGPLPSRLPSVEVTEVARLALTEGTPQEKLVEVWYPDRLTLRVQAAPLDTDPAVMVVLQDVSEEVRTQRIRREFVAHASHELKSPVASIQALAEAVNGAVPDDLEAAERFSARLVGEADRLGKLVSDLLDLSRLEDPVRLPEDPCDLAGVVRREVARLEAAAYDAEIVLSSRVGGELWIKGDPQQLALLVRNLLENAIQYTSAGGHVTVSTERTPTEAVLRIVDDGVGIPLEAQARVFERFYRVDRARSRDRGGTGLGLAIVKHVAELHAGAIELTSELGQGSTFGVRFPLLERSSERSTKETA